LTKIFLDAGHGGKDSGAVGNGISEKNIVLSIVKKINDHLNSYKNVQTMLSRNDDTFLTLDQRTDQANSWGADVFLSIHVNSATDQSARGFETYIYPTTGPDTISFQNVMHQEITRKISPYLGFNDRGKKRSNFHVLRESNMKALLTENLFISNIADSTLLKSDEFLSSIALGHVIGLEKFFGLEHIQSPSNNDSILYQVITGTFTEYENAQKKVEELKKDGHESYIQEKH
jgi:N-acetylmuramoyl-L-alanine amidase